MTEAQSKRLYWPRWGKVAARNAWRMVEGRLVCDREQNRVESDWHRQVWALAEQLAQDKSRAVTPDDLRHACHLMVSDEESHSRLTNPEINRLLDLFTLLIDPLDLDAVLRWQKPEEAAKKSLIAYLKKTFGDDRISALSRAIFKTEYWEDLEIWQIRLLTKRAKRRNG